MATANVIPGEGSYLQVAISSTQTTIAQIYEVDGPEILVEAIDKTALNSGLIITRPSKFPEPDKVSFKIWYDPNDTVTQELITTDIQAPGTIEAFQIVFNDSHGTHAMATFSGFFTSFKLNGMKVKSNIGADVEIKLTTILTITVGSG